MAAGGIFGEEGDGSTHMEQSPATHPAVRHWGELFDQEDIMDEVGRPIGMIIRSGTQDGGGEEERDRNPCEFSRWLLKTKLTRGRATES